MKLFGRELEENPFNPLSKVKQHWEITDGDTLYSMTEYLVSTVSSPEGTFRFKAQVLSSVPALRVFACGNGNTPEEAEADLLDHLHLFSVFHVTEHPPQKLPPLNMMGRTLQGSRKDKTSFWSFEEEKDGDSLKWQVSTTYSPHGHEGDWYFANWYFARCCTANGYQVYAEGPTPEEAIAKFELVLVDQVRALQSMFSQNSLTGPRGLIHD